MVLDEARGLRSHVGAKALGGAAWVTGSRLSTQAVQFLVGLALARVLTPKDFGLVASVYVVTGLAMLFFELGFGAALVQWREPTERDLSTVFWVNALGGIVFVLLLWALAPAVAALFGQPALVGLTPLVGLAFAVSIGVVHQAQLQRSFRFRTVAVIDFVAAALGSAATLLLALLGVGPASLALGPVLTCATASALVMIAAPWRPRSFISVASLRRLWNFSAGVLGSRVLQYAAASADSLVLGRYAGPAALGYYNRAFALMLLPVNQLGGALGSVLFPVLASMQADPARLRAAYLRSLRVLALVATPVLVGMGLTANRLVPFLCGDRWGPTVPLLALLAVAGVPRSLSMSAGWLMQAQARTRALFAVTVLEAALLISGIVAGLHWGPSGVAAGVLVASWLFLPAGLAVGLHGTGTAPRDLIRALLPAAVGVTAMTAAVLLAERLCAGLPDAPALLIEATVGAAVYAGALHLTARAALAEVASLLLRRPRRG